jgi:hypothetical protein
MLILYVLMMTIGVTTHLQVYGSGYEFGDDRRAKKGTIEKGGREAAQKETIR